PGQVWSKGRGTCVGVPQCTPPRLASGESCSCPSGQVSEPDMQGQCCFPGQVWSSAKARCVGLPTQCPPGQAPDGERCAAPLASELPAPPLPSAPQPPVVAPPAASPAPAAESKCPAEAQPEWQWASAPQKRALLDACRAEQQKNAAAPAPATPPPAAPAATLVASPAAAAAPPATVVRADEAPGRSAPPKRSRTSLTTGVMLGETTGGMLALPIRVGLFSIKPGESLQGTASLLVTPALFASVQDVPYASYFQAGAALGLAAGWHQRLGPVELFPYGGASAWLVYRMLQSNSSNWGLNLVFRGVVGLTFAVPAGEGTKFVLGGQVQLGGASTLGMIYIGVEF
ncbi:MAG: hypothetical protein H6Q89_2208, partial [Myxococcaceae bacterium]|nr:hypothetical protein [Myxococcaceae bacterium]